jgi:hypothetical protein
VSCISGGSSEAAPSRTSDRSGAVPAWRERAAAAFHGSTIRLFDPKIGAWRSTWIEPINGRVRRFIGRAVGEDIVLISDEEEPQLRWRFREITRTSFTWLGEISYDHGGTWTLAEQMRARRSDPE